MIMDRHLDVVFLGQFLEVIPDLEIRRLHHHELESHEFREHEQLAIHFLVQRRARHAKGIGMQTVRLQLGLLRSNLFLGFLGVIHVVGNQLQLLDPMLLGELDHLIEVHVAERPGLDGQLINQLRAGGEDQ